MSDLRIRSNPSLELQPLDDLPPGQREPFLELANDPDFFGLLVPKPPCRMNLQSADRQTAALFQSLRTPSLINADEETIDLVLDGIFEIESEDGFVSGADALPLLFPADSARKVAGQLSREALLHAQDLETDEPQALSVALYCFNRIPLTPFWKSRFPDAAAILTHLGADGGALRALLEREWVMSQTMNAWISWGSRTATRRTADDVTHKLYVSPRPERIAEVFAIVVRVLSEFEGVPFKIANSAAGLLRPDKLVAYFRTREQLGAVANVLRRELAGCDAHGVPFTAALDDSGLLSWGVDPPASSRALAWLGRESWRYWVAHRLGTALAVAKTARTAKAIEPWRFAIERARRHGVDVETWTPSATLWSAS